MVELVLKVSEYDCNNLKEAVSKCLPSLVSVLADEGITVESLVSIDKSSPLVREASNNFYIIKENEIDKDFNNLVSINNYNYYVIRIPVEGFESWEYRISLAEDVILRSGNSLDSNKKNVYFFFDTGNFDDFKQVVDIIFSTSDVGEYFRNYCKKYNLSYIGWLTKSNRDFIRKIERDNKVG